MKVTIYTASGKAIRASKNLRGILDYARRSPVDSVRLEPWPDEPGYYAVHFKFYDGANAVTKWADWRVCADWLRSRRSWGLIAESKLQGPIEFVDRYWRR
jgi:hypothetical protein